MDKKDYKELVKINDKVLEKNRTEFIDNFWLNLGDTSKIQTYNTIGTNQIFIEDPVLGTVDFMRRPENFWWTCKILFNLRLHPFQVVCQQILWNHTFTAFMASRGGSKSLGLAIYSLLLAIFKPGSKIILTGSSFRQAKVIFSYCENIWKNSPMLQDILSDDKNNRPSHEQDMHRFKIGKSVIMAIPTGDGEKIRGQRATCLHPDTIIETDVGLMRIDDYQNYLDTNPAVYTGNCNIPLEKPSYFIKTPNIDAYQVKTMGGYDFVCSGIHEVMTTNGWKLGKDLTADDSLIFENNYKFPEQNIQIEDVELDEQLGWLLGILLSEGNINTTGSMSIKMIDKNCIDRVEKCWRLLNDKYNWDLNICRYINEEKIDKRGWTNKKSYEIKIGNCKVRDILAKFGLDRAKSKQKRIPWAILMSPKKTVLAFLAALMEGDGTCYHWKDKMSDKNLGVAFYSSSKQLVDEVQILMTKLGLFITKGSRASKLSIHTQFFLRAYGPNASKLFELLDVPKWYNFKNNYYIGNGFKRQLKTSLKVKKVIKLDEKVSMRDFNLPVTHSFYGNSFIQHNCLIADEFNSIDINVYEEVMQGFASVSMNPVERVIERARYRALLNMGDISEETYRDISQKGSSNQQIISGTPGYTFENLHKYWKKYHDIIMTRGDKEKIKNIFGDEIPMGFNWKDYAILRLPYDILPDGYMDEKTIGKAKATTNSGIFFSEYGSCFVSDSLGFFRRTLIEKCVCGHQNKIIKNGYEVEFNATLRGNPKDKYVIAIDPASERDNFAIVILRVASNYREIVYCWTINEKKHKEKLKRGLVKEHDYYRYCCRKLRDLMKVFPTEHIVCDSQGGGVPIREGLGDPNNLEPGEHAIYPIIEKDDRKDTDFLPGLHILQLIHFANADWVYEANHALKQDFETQELLFPLKDSVSFGIARAEDLIYKRIQVSDEDPDYEDYCDTLEDCMLEIEELKNELVLIEHSKTPSGRDKWDTPTVKGVGTKKGKLLKDRYSALLMANAVARTLIPRIPVQEYAYGGTAINLSRKKKTDVGVTYGFAVKGKKMIR